MLSSYDEKHTHASVRIQTADGVATVWLAGSTKPAHWLHHFLPMAGKREINAAREIAGYIIDDEEEINTLNILGHSLGGAIAHVLASLFNYDNYGMQINCKTYGSKRPPNYFVFNDSINYRNRGDFVPFLPPWRKKIKTKITDKKWQPVWIAHEY